MHSIIKDDHIIIMDLSETKPAILLCYGPQQTYLD